MLEFYQRERRRWEEKGASEPFELSRADCFALSQEASQYYWRRISFFELQEYGRAENDALHNLAILELCRQCGAEDEDLRMAEHHTPFVLAHRFQARAMGRLERQDFAGALREVDAGIERIQDYLHGSGQLERVEDSPEVEFLRAWAEQIQEQRPRTERERLSEDLEEAVARDQFEVAARLRDRLLELDVQREGTDDASADE